MRRRQRGHRRRSRTSSHQRAGGLTLTALMDILTCLLFFVLKSYVAGGEAAVPPPGLDLPASNAESPMVTSLVIAVDRNAIFVGGERVASVSEASASAGLLIEPLAARLEAARSQMDDLARQKGVEPAKTRIVTLQGDADLEFDVLQKVMYTLNQGGFPDVALAVLKKA